MLNIESRNGWYTAVVKVPKKLQPILGKAKFSQALGTTNPREAQRLAAPFIARWKFEIEKARGGHGIAAKAAQEWRTYFAEQVAAIEGAPSGASRAALEAGMEELRSTFVDHLRSLPEPQAATLAGLVDGSRVLTSEYFEAWKSQLDLAPKTIDQMASDIALLIERFVTLDGITKEGVLLFISDLERAGKGPATVKRVLCSYRNYWSYLQDSHIVSIEHDPFDLSRLLAGKFKRAAKKKAQRRAFTPAEVVQLWSLALDKGDQPLADLIALGAYTGARIEELCSLKVGDVYPESFIVREAKTSAGVREVPIHSALAPLISRLKASAEDGYLLAGLTFNKYGDRSNAIGKRFGRLKDGAGFDSTLVFHSLRKTLITLLEQAGIPENFCCDIVGHEKGTIGYGHYSGGASLANKSAAIESIRYPFPDGMLA